jgi:uncharacterized phage protein gp47/JayE
MITFPTATEFSDQILADIEGAVGQNSPILPKAFLRVLSKALGGALALVCRIIRWSYAQIFPATADEEALQRRAAEYGLSQRPAVAVVVDVTVTGDNDTQIPAGTVWSANGYQFSQNALAVISLGTVTVRLTCTEGGAAPTPIAGDDFTVASPITGIASAEAAAIISEGEDEETVEEFRVRVMARCSHQPQGGSAADYVDWAMEVPGIIKAFAFRTAAGEVTVYPLESSSGTSRVPAAGKLAEVLDYVSNPSRRPLCADVLVAAMTERTVDITITTLNPSDATTKSAIEAEARRYLYAAYPRQYPDEPNPTNVITAAAIWATIRDAGSSAASLTMTVSGTGEVTRYELDDGEIVKLGAITWA